MKAKALLASVKAAHALEVARLTRIIQSQSTKVAPPAAAQVPLAVPMSEKEIAALVTGMALAVTQVASCPSPTSEYPSATKFSLNPCLRPFLEGTTATAPLSWRRFQPTLAAMGSVTASDFIVGFHGSRAPGAIMCQGWDTNLRKGQHHGPGEYFDTNMSYSLLDYGRKAEGVVVTLIVRSKARVFDGVPLVVVDNPKGAQDASTAAFCFPLGFVMQPDKTPPPSCSRCVGACHPTTTSADNVAADP